MSFAEPPPEQQAAQGPVYTLSSWGRRVGGAFIDWGIAVIISYSGFILAGGPGALSSLTSLLGFVFLIWNLVLQGNTGQTVGKRAIGIKLITEAEAKVVGPGISIGRYFLHILDGLPCMIGYLNPLWDSKRQTFADKIVKTVVINL